MISKKLIKASLGGAAAAMTCLCALPAVAAPGIVAMSSADIDGFVRGASIQSGLTQITSDQSSDVSELSFVIDAGGVVQGISFATATPGSATTTQNFSLADIESPNGVLLVKKQGHNIFYLKGTVDSAAGTGAMVIRYLANGLLGTYQDCPANVGRTPDGEWHLYNASTGQVVTSAKVETWSLGVTTIQGICDGGGDGLMASAMSLIGF